MTKVLPVAFLLMSLALPTERVAAQERSLDFFNTSSSAAWTTDAYNPFAAVLAPAGFDGVFVLAVRSATTSDRGKGRSIVSALLEKAKEHKKVRGDAPAEHGDRDGDIPVTSTPEPASVLLFATGAVAVLAAARRRKKH